MTTKLLHEHAGLRTFAVIFDTGDDPIEGLVSFARQQRLRGAQITAIGAFQRVTLGYFEWARKDYRRISFEEQLEVLALTGNLGVKEGEPALHAHVVLGRSDGTAHGGHLLEASVRPTLEVLAVETPHYLQRRMDRVTGLALIDLAS